MCWVIGGTSDVNRQAVKIDHFRHSVSAGRWWIHLHRPSIGLITIVVSRTKMPDYYMIHIYMYLHRVRLMVRKVAWAFRHFRTPHQEISRCGKFLGERQKSWSGAGMTPYIQTNWPILIGASRVYPKPRWTVHVRPLAATGSRTSAFENVNSILCGQ
jgi:hypothetical protein